MRREKQIDFGDGRSAILREMNMRQLMRLTENGDSSGKAEIAVIRELLLMTGCEFEDLSFSEFDQIQTAFKEMHRPT